MRFLWLPAGPTFLNHNQSNDLLCFFSLSLSLLNVESIMISFSPWLLRNGICVHYCTGFRFSLRLPYIPSINFFSLPAPSWSLTGARLPRLAATLNVVSRRWQKESRERELKLVLLPSRRQVPIVVILWLCLKRRICSILGKLKKK